MVLYVVPMFSSPSSPSSPTPTTLRTAAGILFEHTPPPPLWSCISSILIYYDSTKYDKKKAKKNGTTPYEHHTCHSTCTHPGATTPPVICILVYFPESALRCIALVCSWHVGLVCLPIFISLQLLYGVRFTPTSPHHERSRRYTILTSTAPGVCSESLITTGTSPCITMLTHPAYPTAS